MANLENSFHGFYSAYEYWQGETRFHWLREQLIEWDGVTLSFLLPPVSDLGLAEATQVKGPVSRVFRDREVPFVELEYLEYDERARSISKDGVDELADLFTLAAHEDDKQLLGDAIADAVNFSLDLENMKLQAGIIPEGIFSDEPAQFNLSTQKIVGFLFSRVPVETI